MKLHMSDWSEWPATRGGVYRRWAGGHNISALANWPGGGGTCDEQAG